MHTEAVVVTSITITLHTCRHAKIWPDHSQIASSGPVLYAGTVDHVPDRDPSSHLFQWKLIL